MKYLLLFLVFLTSCNPFYWEYLYRAKLVKDGSIVIMRTHNPYQKGDTVRTGINGAGQVIAYPGSDMLVVIQGEINR